MKTILVVLLCMLLLPCAVRTQDATPVTGSFKAAGKCGMCKTRIEHALEIEGVKEAHWDKRSHRVTVEFLSPPLSLDSLQKRVAAVGHDTEKFKAADSVYSNLPGCCLYRASTKGH
jgi:mercuric ion binding protein